MDTRHNLSGAYANAVRAIPEERWLYLEYQESISDQIAQHMEQHDISRTALAERLGTSKAYITKILRGDANMTMKTLVQLLFALGLKPVTQVVDKNASQPVTGEKERAKILRLVKKQITNEESWDVQRGETAYAPDDLQQAV